ncbi:aminodeoxychorismate/anthranilate synthase component II [Parvularcula sp. IMCC14364]|uniref:anthranilate synthase component II n=1 Tax=Parvularcula sp. IMCC14364 TaxID=3067902 RepID=UPI002741A66D|nr:aminodeoxychorismate/anthranilate synthase component II [Parvularcula sp. IMCC14364]
MILVIDNYDSFVHNLARYVRELGDETHIVRNDRLSDADISWPSVRGIILSPGPGRPQSAGDCLKVIYEKRDTPVLGVCLGHQCLAESYGGITVSAKEPMHGRASSITHDNTGVFKGVANPFQAGRYHSLASNISTSTELMEQAYTEDGEVMGFRHKTYPHHGVQFHPESLLTTEGKKIISNFLSIVSEMVS